MKNTIIKCSSNNNILRLNGIVCAAADSNLGVVCDVTVAGL